MKERVNLNNIYKIQFKINALTVAGKTKVMTKEFYDLKTSKYKKIYQLCISINGKK